MQARMPIASIILAVVLPLAVGVAAPAQGATFYVSPQGSDSAAGTITAPFRTVNFAVTRLGELVVRGAGDAACAERAGGIDRDHLAGLQRPTAGSVIVNGGEVHLKHPADAAKLGIAMIHQELNLVDELTVADNIFLGREKTAFGYVRAAQMNDAARKLLARNISTTFALRASPCTSSVSSGGSHSKPSPITS